jgi:hypothetical protein
MLIIDSTGFEVTRVFARRPSMPRPEFRRSRAHTGLINWIVAGQRPEGSPEGDLV